MLITKCKLILTSLPVLLAIASTPVWSAGSDELWEMKVSMDMGGMTMPAPSTQSCIAKGGNYKPENGQQDKHCQVTDYKVSGQKVTWKMQCSGTDAMSGSGELTKTATSMKGIITMSSGDMQMKQVINGKLIGTCDAAAEKKKVDKMVTDIKQQSEESIKQTCEDNSTRDAESGGYGNDGASVYRAKQLCAGYQPQLCKKARAYTSTNKGYLAYNKNRSSMMAKIQSWGWVLSECGIDLDKNRAKLCKQAVTSKAYRFIGGQCPDEAKTLNDKYCAGFGMDQTADMTRPNADMCLALRSKGESGGEPGEDSGTDAAGNNGDKAQTKSGKEKNSDNPAAKAMDAVNKLKGMFGF